MTMKYTIYGEIYKLIAQARVENDYEIWASAMHQVQSHTQNVSLAQYISERGNIPLPETWVSAATEAYTQAQHEAEASLQTQRAAGDTDCMKAALLQLAHVEAAAGQWQGALRYYTRCRDYVTSVAALQLECEIAAAAVFGLAWDMVGAAMSRAIAILGRSIGVPQYAKLQATIQFYQGLYHYHMKKWSSAAACWATLGSDCEAEVQQLGMTWVQVWSAMALCAVAADTRQAIVAGNGPLGAETLHASLADAAPEAAATLRAYRDAAIPGLYASSRACKSYVQSAPHIQGLSDVVHRQAAGAILAMYLQPFQRVPLQDVAATFGMSIDETMTWLEKLILVGHLHAQMDAVEGILTCQHVQTRAATIVALQRMAATYETSGHAVSARLAAAQAGLFIPPPGTSATRPDGPRSASGRSLQAEMMDA